MTEDPVTIEFRGLQDPRADAAAADLSRVLTRMRDRIRAAKPNTIINFTALAPDLSRAVAGIADLSGATPDHAFGVTATAMHKAGITLNDGDALRLAREMCCLADSRSPIAAYITDLLGRCSGDHLIAMDVLNARGRLTR